MSPDLSENPRTDGISPKPHGGRRAGAGRKPKIVCIGCGFAPSPVFPLAAAVTAAIANVAGESNVTLEADSKGQIKPKVSVTHRDPDVAAATAQRIFDELVVRYWRITMPEKVAV